MNKHYVLLSIIIIVLIVREARSQSPCASRCPDTKGYVFNCALNKPSYLLDEKKAISQLQCFDHCLRHQRCRVYNFKQQNKSCELFRGLWSFDDENSLVAQNSTVFSWMGRDQYTLWTKPTCLANTCQAQNSSVIGYCKKPLDMAFLVDTSTQNIGELNLTKQFIAKVSEKFEQSPEYTKIGIVEYTTYASVIFSFNNFSTSMQFQRFLKSIPQGSGSTRWDRALHEAESELFSSQGGARPFAHRVVVLITNSDIKDGAENVYPLSDLKQALKKKCVKTFAVGIADAGKKAAARIVNSDNNSLLQVDLFKELDAKADNFANKICSAVP